MCRVGETEWKGQQDLTGHGEEPWEGLEHNQIHEDEQSLRGAVSSCCSHAGDPVRGTASRCQWGLEMV